MRAAGQARRRARVPEMANGPGSLKQDPGPFGGGGAIAPGPFGGGGAIAPAPFGGGRAIAPRLSASTAAGARRSPRDCHSWTNAPSKSIVLCRVGETPLTESFTTTYSCALASTANGTTRL